MAKGLGYINVTVDEMNEDGTVAKNVLTIHSVAEEGNLIAQLDSEMIILFKLGSASAACSISTPLRTMLRQ